MYVNIDVINDNMQHGKLFLNYFYGEFMLLNMLKAIKSGYDNINVSIHVSMITCVMGSYF